MKKLIRTLSITYLALVALTAVAFAQITTLKDALNTALKQKDIASVGESMKLYSASAYRKGKRGSWSFTFYDGRDLYHTLRVDTRARTYYTTKPKGRQSILQDLDFSKLPAPTSVIVVDALNRSKAALTALGFKPTNSGNYRINYHLRSAVHQKSTAIHTFHVSLPTSDGQQGKTVTFKNGKLDTVSNSSIQD